MTEENAAEDVTPTATEKDWRSEREKNGWCRCGKREAEPSPQCGWHEARATREAV